MIENLHKDNLSIEVEYRDNTKELILNWNGKSTSRAPDFFLIPYFNTIIEDLKENGHSLILNFFPLEYMNSSTINPIVTLLKKLRDEKINARIIYNKDLKWQKLSFSTLQVFITDDNLLSIEEVHKDWKLS